jgi:hypothetical protein
MSHDQNFKNLILDYPRQALAFFAQAEAAGIGEDARIVPIRQEQLQERLGERFRELDVPLLVEWPDGRREAILFMLEEESVARRFSIHRLAHYCLHLAELFGTERVVPVVIFLRTAAGIPQHLRLGGDRHTYLEFRYLSCALAELPFERYRDSDNLVARLNLPNMRYATSQKVEVYARAVSGLINLEQDPEKQLKYLDYIDIYGALDDNERAQYERDYPEEAQTMSNFAERFLQKGMQQGMQQGEARVLARQLQLKFGELSEEVRKRIEQADEQTLLAWSERVLTANRLDEVLH